MEDKRSESRRCDTCRWYDWGKCDRWFFNDPTENHPMPVSGDGCCCHWESRRRDYSACGSEDRTDGRHA